MRGSRSGRLAASLIPNSGRLLSAVGQAVQERGQVACLPGPGNCRRTRRAAGGGGKRQEARGKSEQGRGPPSVIPSAARNPRPGGGCLTLFGMTKTWGL